MTAIDSCNLCTVPLSSAPAELCKSLIIKIMALSIFFLNSTSCFLDYWEQIVRPTKPAGLGLHSEECISTGTCIQYVDLSQSHKNSKNLFLVYCDKYTIQKATIWFIQPFSKPSLLGTARWALANRNSVWMMKDHTNITYGNEIGLDPVEDNSTQLVLWPHRQKSGQQKFERKGQGAINPWP